MPYCLLGANSIFLAIWSDNMSNQKYFSRIIKVIVSKKYYDISFLADKWL